ncbi:MAG: MerR family DNA-binding protein [Chroococcales cyanobacterium]
MLILTEEIKTLIELRSQGIFPCASLKKMLKQHLENLDEQIEEMVRFRQELAERYEQVELFLSQIPPIEVANPDSGKICVLFNQDTEETDIEYCGS